MDRESYQYQKQKLELDSFYLKKEIEEDINIAKNKESLEKFKLTNIKPLDYIIVLLVIVIMCIIFWPYLKDSLEIIKYIK